VVDSLVKTNSDGRASSDSESRRLGSVGLRASVATDVITGDIGDRAVVVRVQADILVVSGTGAARDQVSEAVVGESSVGKCQQAARCCELEMHDSAKDFGNRLELAQTRCCVRKK
jgi:hypothetical protein